MPEQIQQIASKLPTIVSSQPIIEWVDSEWLSHRLDVRFYEPRFLENLAELSTLQMERTSLRHLAKLDGGGAFPAAEFSDSGPIPTAKIGDITHQRYPNEWVRLTYQAFEKFGKAETRYPDVLVTMTGDPPDVGKCMMVPQWDTLIAYNQRVARVRCDSSSANSFYVGAFMSTERARLQLEKVCTGIRQRHVTLDDIRGMIVPLPPRPVQEYIGAKVRLAERCRTRAGELRMNATNALRKALGKVPEIHTGKSTAWVNPQNVLDRIDPDYFNQRYLTLESQVKDLTGRSLALGQVCDVFSGTSAPDQEDETTRRVVKVGGLSEDGIDWGNTSYLRADRKVKSRFVLRDGDVMFCCAAHHHSYIGKKVTLALVGLIKAVPTPEVMVCRSQDDQLLSGYLAEFLRSPWGYWQVQRTVKGITAHAYSNDVMRIVIPVIPLEIQEQIDRALREASQLIIKSRGLVREAKADVEALIEGWLDVEGIVAGRVQPLTWEDVEV